MEKKNQQNVIYLDMPNTTTEYTPPTPEELEMAIESAGVYHLHNIEVTKEEAERTQKAIAEMFGT